MGGTTPQIVSNKRHKRRNLILCTITRIKLTNKTPKIIKLITHKPNLKHTRHLLQNVKHYHHLAIK